MTAILLHHVYTGTHPLVREIEITAYVTYAPPRRLPLATDDLLWCEVD